jgi:hypothetical protein
MVETNEPGPSGVIAFFLEMKDHIFFLMCNKKNTSFFFLSLEPVLFSEVETSIFRVRNHGWMCCFLNLFNTWLKMRLRPMAKPPKVTHIEGGPTAWLVLEF